MSDHRFEQELAQGSLAIQRNLPGVPVKDSKGNVPFYWGRIINQSETIQWATLDHPEHKRVFFAGDAFMWWCPRCQVTIYEQECQMRFSRSCTLCRGPVLALSPGDWIRVHFRHHPALQWANWWGWRVIR